MNDIADLLRRAIPEDPDAREWAQVARRRHGRRRAGLAAAVVAVLMVAAIPIGMLLPRDHRPAIVGSALATEEAQGEANPCAALIATAQEATQPVQLGGPLPDGAERAWLCAQDPNTDEPRLTTAGPHEPLTQDVARALELTRSLEPADPAAACTTEDGLTFYVLYDYPDRRRAIQGQVFGCGHVSDGETTWTGAESLLGELVQLWLEQRARGESPTAGLPGECPAAWSLVPADPARLTGGYACFPTAAKQLGHELFERARTEYASATLTESPAEYGPDPDSPHLRFVDDWGSVIALAPAADGGFTVWAQPESTPRRWRPSAQLEADLLAALRN